jgi:uncharacterized protein YsxB (DUF464 family)
MNTFNNVTRDKRTNAINIDIRRFNSKEDYEVVVKSIEDNYRSKTKFSLTIETKDLLYENISMKYVYLFSSFMIRLKKIHFQYLEKTDIKVYDQRVFDLLYYLFLYLCSPVATVRVIYYNRETNDILKIKSYYVL